MQKTFVKISLLTLCVWSWTAFAQDVTFEARVDKTRMVLEDTLALSFVLSGSAIDLNVSPELPDVKADFDILRGPHRSTSISIINGRQSSSLTLQYLLSPKKTGTLTIGPATLRVGNQTYTTQPLPVEVVEGTQTPGATAPDAPGRQPAPGDDANVAADVFIQAHVDKTTAYIGEQVNLSLVLYTRVNISGYELTQQPGLTGFWIEEYQLPQPRLQEQMVNGVQYGVAVLKKSALFPTTSGQITIDPLTMTFSVNVRGRSNDPFDQFFNDPFDNFFGRTQEIIRKTQPIELTVLPLPDEGKPAFFNGDVGNFTMQVQLDTTQVKQGDPLTLTVKIQGRGNIKTLKEPQMTLPSGFKRYDPEIKEQVLAEQDVFQGEKVFTSVIIPSEAETFQLEPVQFAYFDPQQKTYQILRSEPFAVTILPSAPSDEPLERRITTKEEVKLLGKDIRFIKTDVPQIVDQGLLLYRTPLFRGILIAPILVLGLMYGYQQYRQKHHQDERVVRQRQARKRSQHYFKTAAEMLQRKDSKAFYASISQALRQYLGDKLGLPSAGIAPDEAGQILLQQGLATDTVGLLKHCLEACDYARFAPVDASFGEMQGVLQNAERVIESIEKLKLRHAPRPASANKLPAAIGIMLLTCVVGQLPTSASPTEDLFQEGNRLYEAGQYAAAAAQYQQILQAGIRNGAVYYNFGNALLKEHRVGEAILAYERAKRLLPRDDDAAFNLAYARALTLDNMETANSAGIVAMLTAVRDMVTLNEAAVALLVTYGMIVALAASLLLTSSAHWRRRILIILVVPVIGCLSAGGILLAQLADRTSVPEAIVLATEIEARNGPGDSYSAVFAIHAGAKVRIQREKAEWVEIQLPNKVIGWVLHTDLERI